jgi:hypothetical protein
VVGPGRVELPAAMGSPPVVMGLVLGQDRPQMPLAEDEHPVGELGPGGEHEPLGISVRTRTPRRDLHSVDAGVGSDKGWLAYRPGGSKAMGAVLETADIGPSRAAIWLVAELRRVSPRPFVCLQDRLAPGREIVRPCSRADRRDGYCHAHRRLQDAGRAVPAPGG